MAIMDKPASSTHGLVAMTSAQHAEGRQFDPGWVYLFDACHGALRLHLFAFCSFGTPCPNEQMR